MRIMLLVSAMNSGGAERVAATLCSAWAARGDDVSLVATYSGRGTCAYQLNSDVELIFLADLVGGNSRIAGYPERILALRRLIQSRKPDVVVSFLINVNIAAVLATRRLAVPLIACERIDPIADTESKWHLRWLRWWLYPMADTITVQTEQGISVMQSQLRLPARIESVSNPVPEELLSLSIGNVGGGARRRIVGMGRLVAQKQWDHLISAFADLASQNEDVDLWIWGEGKLRADLEARVAALGLLGRVFLPGSTSTPWQEMAAGDMVVLTSAYEGFPNVLLEAMALGIPCVAYDCPTGPRDVSDNGKAARLIPLNDRKELKHAIMALLEDRQERRRLGELALTSVRARYRLRSVLDRWDQIIDTARHGAPVRSGLHGPRSD